MIDHEVTHEIMLNNVLEIKEKKTITISDEGEEDFCHKVFLVSLRGGDIFAIHFYADRGEQLEIKKEK